MGFEPFGTGWQAQAQTTDAGTPLVNGTGTIISWTTPNDGKQHPFMVVGQVNVTSAETGGQIQVTYTPPNGATRTAQLTPGGSGLGVAVFAFVANVAAPGTTITVAQSTALTAGAAVANAAIIGQ